MNKRQYQASGLCCFSILWSENNRKQETKRNRIEKAVKDKSDSDTNSRESS